MIGANPVKSAVTGLFYLFNILYETFWEFIYVENIVIDVLLSAFNVDFISFFLKSEA